MATLRALWPGRYPRGSRRRKGVIAAWIAAGVAVCIAADLVIGTPGADEIRQLSRVPRATTVFDINGQLAFTIFTERRIEVPLSEVSPNVVHAVLAIEDQRFFTHSGIDPWRIGGALLANIRHGATVQGGSTITQQLARKSFLTDERTIRRKLREILLAIRIERRFTKDQILEMYLNRVYFGEGYYGIEAAARGYFGKTAATVSVEEAALLAGLIKAPSAYAPPLHLDRATARRTTVLRQMVAAGFLDTATETSLEHATVSLVDGFGHEHTGQYFKNHVTRLLVDRFGWDMVSQGGLRVYATVDSRMQQAADTILAKSLADTEKMPAYRHPKRGDPRTIHAGQSPDYLQGALVAMDPSTGEVRAMTGGRDFDESQFNRAVQARRQAGSAFKPFVYAAAIDAGYTPASLLTNLDDPMMMPAGAWLPDDAHLESTAMTLRTGLRTSSNRAALQVLRAVGIPQAVTFAQRLGLEAPPVPSLVLGSGNVSVLAMAAAYGAFANGGWLRPPVFIRRVEDRFGHVLFTDASQSTRAITEDTAFLMAQMLADVINSGTGYRAREAGFKFQAGGKTGTTNDYRDAWFVGFTPQLVTSVWLGFDQPKTIVAGGYAGQLAAPIWGRFMQQVSGGKDSGWVPRPSSIVGVEICRLSGGLPTEDCKHALTRGDDGELSERSYVGVEYFHRGTEPTEFCQIHGDGVVDPFRPSIGGARTRPGIAAAPPLPAGVTSPAMASSSSKGLFGKVKNLFKRASPPPKATPSGRGGGGD